MARNTLNLILIIAILFCPYSCKRGVCASSVCSSATTSCCDTHTVDQDFCCEHHDCCPTEQSCEQCSPQDTSSKSQPENKNPHHCPSKPNDPSQCSCQGICGGAILEENESVTSQADETLHTVASSHIQIQFFPQTSVATFCKARWSPSSSLRILYQSFLL